MVRQAFWIKYISAMSFLDQWRQVRQLYICRIKTSTNKTFISHNPVLADSNVFFDAMVLLGTAGLMVVQILIGLIAYLLLAIYCHKYFHEKVSIGHEQASPTSRGRACLFFKWMM